MDRSKSRIEISDLPQNAKLDLTEAEIRTVTGGGRLRRRILGGRTALRDDPRGIRALGIRLGVRATKLKW